MTGSAIPGEEIMRLRATGPRRLIGTGTLAGLGALLVWLAFDELAGEPLWQALIAALGLLALWFATFMWRATGRDLILTDAGLYDSAGTTVAALDEVEKVDRSMFAMKPSNGFLVMLKAKGARQWQPGLYWRLGKRVAVGGVTAARDTKPMADALTLLVARRDGTLPDL